MTSKFKEKTHSPPKGPQGGPRGPEPLGQTPGPAAESSDHLHRLQESNRALRQEIARREEAEEEIRRSEERYRTLVEDLPLGVYYSDFNGQFIYGNRKAEEIVGYKREELIGQKYLKLKILSPKEIIKAARLLALHRLGRGTGPDQFTLIRKDGSSCSVEVTTKVIAIGGHKVVMGLVEDMTERQQALKALQDSEARHRLLAENVSDVIWTTDLNLKPTYISPSVERLLGYSAAEAMALTMEKVIVPASAEVIRKALIEEIIAEKTGQTDPSRVRTLEVEAACQNGSTKYVEVRVIFLRDEKGQPIEILGVARDITARRRAELEREALIEELKETKAELERLSLVDGLTGVFNRRYFDEGIEREMKRTQREARPLSLIMIDIDFFKDYNDAYGHQAGDNCLKEVAAAMSDALRRPGDFAARYGGEEFVCVLPRTEPQGALEVAEAIHANVAALNIPHQQSSVSGSVSVSLGVATWRPDLAASSVDLIAAADQALYEAKRQGRNRIKVAPMAWSGSS